MEKTKKRAHWGWYWFDFGNSAYAAVILLAVYAAYFQGTVVGGAEGTRLWGISMGLAMLVVALVSPILGAIADYSVAKKKFRIQEKKKRNSGRKPRVTSHKPQGMAAGRQ